MSGSFEEYLARIDKKQRHEIRRKMRRAAESEKNVRFHVIDQTADIGAETEAFFNLMVQDSNKEQFLHPEMREQMTITIRNAFERSYLWLAFLEVDGSTAAASLNFDYKDKLWGYNSGVGREHMELSPGWVLLAHVIQWCAEHGRTEFDFMRNLAGEAASQARRSEVEPRQEQQPARPCPRRGGPVSPPAVEGLQDPVRRVARGRLRPHSRRRARRPVDGYTGEVVIESPAG